MSGVLYLIPAPLADTAVNSILPEAVQTQANRLNHWVVESAKTARRWLKLYAPQRPMQQLCFYEMGQAKLPQQWQTLLAPLRAGHDVGLMSDAGCPGIADPGAILVRLAHQEGIRVVPLVGPCSILLGLMASGTCGQRFRFHGYLAIKPQARIQQLRQIEYAAKRYDEAQLFIETPYRNKALLATIIEVCADNSLLSIACDITGAHEFIATHSISQWRYLPTPSLHQQPTLFTLYHAADPMQPRRGVKAKR